MKTFQTIQEVRAFSESEQNKGKTVGFVPTMGALHKGHLDLIRASKEKCDITLASIFVNPTQFNKAEDLEKYPRDVHRDIKLLEDAGCNAVFTPSVNEVYKHGSDVKIELGNITNELEGKFRPGHFNGVALVVSKLFNIVKPNVAFFGQKDIQQFYVIKKLRDALNFPINLEMVPTKREANGLAMSSRNERLEIADRDHASLIYKSLQKAKKELQDGQDLAEVKERLAELFSNSNGLTLEYFEAVNSEDFKPLSRITKGENIVLCLAAEIDNVRLIDNIPLFS